MPSIADIMVAFVAVLHGLFLILEMFLWKRPLGRKIFGTSKEYAESTAVLAANQGLYNGFLVAGLIWSLLSDAYGLQLKAFFLSCIVLAGLFGAMTAKRLILWIQAFPGAVALAFVLFLQL